MRSSERQSASKQGVEEGLSDKTEVRGIPWRELKIAVRESSDYEESLWFPDYN